MFWIKTYDGDLCNLALASDIQVVPDYDRVRYEVRAIFPSGGEETDRTVLFRTDNYRDDTDKDREAMNKKEAKAQAEAYRDMLYAAIPRLSKLAEL